MSFVEILKIVFPLLEGRDLATCLSVCKQWQELGKEDYFWKALCTKRWPSISKLSSSPSLTYYQLFKTFNNRKPNKTLLPPKLSFNDLEFYIDVWSEEKLIFSEVIPGHFLRKGVWIPPPGICDDLRSYLEGPEYKMTFPVQPKFNVPFDQAVSVSVLAGRKDSNKVACVMNKSFCNYIDRSTHRAFGYDFLDFSPSHPFVSCIRAWISLFFMDHSEEGIVDVFGIGLDFCDTAETEDQVLWLFDILDWK